MPHSKDLFDDSTMTFGEHLEALRSHLWKALIGLLLCVIVALHPTISQNVIGLIRLPLDNALAEYGKPPSEDEDFFGKFLNAIGMGDADEPGSPPASDGTAEEGETNGNGAAAADPEANEPPANAAVPEPPLPEPTGDPRIDALRLEMRDVRVELGELKAAFLAQRPTPTNTADSTGAAEVAGETRQRIMPQTLNVQEAFMIYLKVAFVSGLVIASPWVFYQLWLFVAAGLYPHERKYVYIYMPISLGLFAVGALFCFFAVFPIVLQFLLSFNKWMGVEPNIRLSEWLSFAILLPVMFGLSFELPLVMLFLERISIFEVRDYREKRRMSILVIAIVSMFLTPADPLSMLMMMFPLLLLYELGILMCQYSPSRSPFGAEAV
ncbi:MAG: twin-arginine translocase subunit TatC [Planctomycetaceae bacterium]